MTEQDEMHAAINIEAAALNRTSGSEDDFARYERNMEEIYANAENHRCQFSTGCPNHPIR